MIHFRNKTDIIDWLEKNCPRRAIVRALREGQVELLGGFYPLSNKIDLAGWVIRVTSRFKRKWNIALVPTKEPQIRILRGISWENWLGLPGGLPHSMLDGDNPDQYRKFRDEAKRMATR